MNDTKKYDIVVVSGGFDPIHKGHIRLFKAAKSLGHKVICGLNSDMWLVNKKGKAFMSFSERSEILQSIRYIDDVISFKDDSEYDDDGKGTFRDNFRLDSGERQEQLFEHRIKPGLSAILRRIAFRA